jgi:hypothetical protein
LFDGLAADRTLGGTVDDADFGDLQFQGSGLVTDGVPHAKGVVIPVVLTFRSSRPFKPKGSRHHGENPHRTDTPKPRDRRRRRPLAYVILLDDWRDHKAGKVLAADPDLLSAADVEGALSRRRPISSAASAALSINRPIDRSS